MNILWSILKEWIVMFFLKISMAKIIGRYSSGITRQFQKWAIRIRTGDVRVAIVKGNPAAAIKRFTPVGKYRF